ncbi:MAG: hypothetical protein M3169_16025 [Candidatus Eremiobacteraeota bacterium]|nr:hypothetical protein [Candidatus Eremiobacteraeota bacterium]
MNRKSSLMVLGIAATLTGCTAGQTGVPPTQQAVDVINANKLQFAVGTARIGASAAVNLNTVVTYRQPNGLDGTLLNTPTIAGPVGFVNTAPAAQAGNDSGTNLISGSLQPIPAGTAPTPTTLNVNGGAFAYGLQPDNSTTGGGVSFARYALPIYAAGTVSPYATIPSSSTAVAYIGGPPAYPNVRDGTFPSGFQGYPTGFTDFLGPTPVVGTYTLTLNVPTGFTSAGVPTSANVSASANLTSLALLPIFPTPSVVFDVDTSVPTPHVTGSATITATVPPGVTEALIILQDRDGLCYPGSNGAPAYYTFRTTTTGLQTFLLPANLGPRFGSQTNVKSVCTGDRYRLYAVGFDYPAFAAGAPNSLSQTPAIVNGVGQADVTTSAIVAPAAGLP